MKYITQDQLDLLKFDLRKYFFFNHFFSHLYQINTTIHNYAADAKNVGNCYQSTPLTRKQKLQIFHNVNH